ncbi:hypothetical protein GGI24_003248, partial [Coemansia furcata]
MSLSASRHLQGKQRLAVQAIAASRNSGSAQPMASRTSKAVPVFNTSVKTLQEVVKLGKSEELSNRQLFARLQADPKTVDRLDMLRLGSEKQGRFERKKWFRYEEPEVKLPHISFFAGAQVVASFPQ